jgi:hypothetical protein
MDNENSEVTSRSRAEFSGHQREEVNTFSARSAPFTTIWVPKSQQHLSSLFAAWRHFYLLSLRPISNPVQEVGERARRQLSRLISIVNCPNRLP